MLIDGYATGALFRPPSPQNFSLLAIKAVQEVLAAGLPPTFMELTQHCVHIYNQGSSPSCVCHATAGVQTANEHIERHGEVMIFDAMAMHMATGPANQGRYPGDILKYAQDVGVPLAQSTKRYRVGSYAFAPNSSPQVWVDTIKAALVSGHVCMCCSQLWSNFGWETSGSVLGPGSYHEWDIVGYRAEPAPFGSAYIQNSWGEGWGHGGFGWVPFQLLVADNFQGGYVIANTIVDAIDGDLDPAPRPPDPPTPNPPDPNPPVPVPFETSLAGKLGTGQAVAGQRVKLTPSGSLWQIAGPVTLSTSPNPPDPNPPDPNPPGPDPPDPNPPEPGDLNVACESAGPALYAWATLNGVSQRCNWRGTLGDAELPPMASTSRYPFRAAWLRANPAGKLATIEAVTLDGNHQGSVQRQF